MTNANQRTVAVTGAGGGLGRDIALGLAAKNPKGQDRYNRNLCPPARTSCVTGRRSNLSEAARENVRELADSDVFYEETANRV